jgi:hypothetical protein
MGATTSPGRRRRRVPGGRPVRVVVRLTADEYASLSARAAEIGHTVPSYLALTGLRPEGVASADIRSALTSLYAVRRVQSSVANNLNQLTAKLHATGELDQGLPGVLEAVARLTNHVGEAVDRVVPLVDGRSKR